MARTLSKRANKRNFRRLTNKVARINAFKPSSARGGKHL